jgi:eukaryotic-like serine/threonine-protein kinase
MSVVWRAYDEVLGRQVAVKLLAAGFSTDPAFRNRIRREARAAAKLNHPNITDVYDYGETVDEAGETQPFVVMELVEGESLAQRLARGPLPWRQAVAICAEVAAALATAHARGLVHRDVTPGNIMLTGTGAKVVDFGISAVVGEAAETDIIGTPAYLAPERLAGAAAQPASDVYSLGLVLHRALAGALPPAPLPPVPPEIADVIHRCRAADPAARPDSRYLAGRLAALAGRAGPSMAPGGGHPTAALPGGRPPDRGPSGTRRMPLPPVMPPPVMAPAPPQGRPPTQQRHQVARRPSGRPAPPQPTILETRRRPRPPRRVRPWPLILSLLGLLTLLLCSSLTLHRSPQDTPGANGSSRRSPTPALTCSVTYRVTYSLASYFTAEVKIANAGSKSIGGWTLTFDFAGDQQVTSGWAGRWDQNGNQVKVQDLFYNRSIDAGKDLTIGFVGSYHDKNGAPRHFSLNGVHCPAKVQPN